VDEGPGPELELEALGVVSVLFWYGWGRRNGWRLLRGIGVGSNDTESDDVEENGVGSGEALGEASESRSSER